MAADSGNRRAEPKEREGGTDTRLALILAAERIFSEEGISNTSLRRINQAAGQRNESAIHYYFGSREGLVAAILELRTTPINAARVRLMREAAKANINLCLDAEEADRLVISLKLLEKLMFHR